MQTGGGGEDIKEIASWISKGDQENNVEFPGVQGISWIRLGISKRSNAIL